MALIADVHVQQILLRCSPLHRPTTEEIAKLHIDASVFTKREPGNDIFGF